MNFKHRKYYLETNALIQLSKEKLEAIGNKGVFTSSFAIMEFIKNTNQDNYTARRNKLNKIIKVIRNIDWATTTEKMQTTFTNIRTVENKEFSLYLQPMIQKYIQSANYEIFLESLSQGIEVDIEEIEKTYKYLNNLIKKIMSGEIDEKRIEEAFVCPQCLLTIHIQNDLKNARIKNLDDEFNYILGSYNNKADIFFDCCYFYFKNYLAQQPNKNDLIDLLHTLYLENKAYCMVTNDKKLKKICEKGGKIKVISVDDIVNIGF